MNSLMSTRPVAGSIQNRPRDGRSRCPDVRIIVCDSFSRYSITQTSVETLKVGDCGRSAVTVGPSPRDFRLNLKRHRLDGSRNLRGNTGTLMFLTIWPML